MSHKEKHMSLRKRKKNKIPIILDCEASGLGEDSYPIEIGIAFEDGSIDSFLIKPAPEWVYWDEQAEQIHKIKKESLSSGKSTYDAIVYLNSQLLDCKVYSDCVEYETFWIDRLFAAHGLHRNFEIESLFVLNSFDHSKFSVEKHKQFEKMQNERHRAGVDAKILQTAYKLSMVN